MLMLCVRFQQHVRKCQGVVVTQVLFLHMDTKFCPACAVHLLPQNRVIVLLCGMSVSRVHSSSCCERQLLIVTIQLAAFSMCCKLCLMLVPEACWHQMHNLACFDMLCTSSPLVLLIHWDMLDWQDTCTLIWPPSTRGQGVLRAVRAPSRSCPSSPCPTTTSPIPSQI